MGTGQKNALYLSVNVFSRRVLSGDTIFARDRKLAWSSKPREGLAKVLARRVSSRLMDAHFWKKHKENSPNLLYVYGKTCLLDGQFSMSG